MHMKKIHTTKPRKTPITSYLGVRNIVGSVVGLAFAIVILLGYAPLPAAIIDSGVVLAAPCTVAETKIVGHRCYGQTPDACVPSGVTTCADDCDAENPRQADNCDDCDPEDTTQTDSSCYVLPPQTITNNCPKGQCIINTYLQPAINLVSALVGLVIAASIISAGIRYATSADNPQKVSEAKQRLVTSIFVLVGFFTFYALMNYLIPGGLV